MGPEISIITPSFRQPELLQRCSRSVLDQPDIRLEHLIQEGGGEQGLAGWKPADPRLHVVVEPDRGMYDAINRGLRKARGEIVGHLNSDEKYLPGVLRRVVDFFRSRPEVDVLFGDAVLIDSTGRPLSYRRIVLPDLEHTARIHLGTLTCSMFFRHRLLERGFFYPDQYRTIGDSLLVMNWLRQGVRMSRMAAPLAVFTFTGANLGASDLARAEGEHSMLASDRTAAPQNPLWQVKGKHRLRKLVAGAYWPRRVTVGIYLPSTPDRRVLVTGWVGFYWPQSGRKKATV